MYTKYIVMDFEVVKFGVIFTLYLYVHIFFYMVFVWDILLWFNIWYIKKIDRCKKVAYKNLN
jgi:hypothetical protein